MDIRNGDSSATNETKNSLERIKSDSLNAFHEVWEDSANEVTSSIPTDAPLHGITVAVKDNIVTTTGTTTCGSKMLDGYKSPFNATVVERLVSDGAVLVGKTNCDELLCVEVTLLNSTS